MTDDVQGTVAQAQLQAGVIDVSFTEQEAHWLLTFLTQTALPYQQSAPLINRLGLAMSHYQNMRRLGMSGPARAVGQAAGSFINSDDNVTADVQSLGKLKPRQ